MWKLTVPALAALLLVTLSPDRTGATPILSGSTLIEDPNGFPGVCEVPCIVANLDWAVWAPGDAGNPNPLAGNRTYVYTITNLLNPPSNAALPFPGIPITEFEVAVNASFVTAAGSIVGSGVAPISITTSSLNVVSWTFPSTMSCPGCLNQGQTSETLFIHSPVGPGLVGASLTAIVLDAPFHATAPVPEPCAALCFAAGFAVVGMTLRRRRA